MIQLLSLLQIYFLVHYVKSSNFEHFCHILTLAVIQPVYLLRYALLIYLNAEQRVRRNSCQPRANCVISTRRLHF